MQCDICHRSASTRLPFNCTICARDALYQARIQQAQVLLETESLGKDIKRRTEGVTLPKGVVHAGGAKSQDPDPTWIVQRAKAEQVDSRDKTNIIITHVDTLREETQTMKADIAARKARILRRRSDFASAKQELSHSQSGTIESLERAIKRTTHRWDVLHKKTAESRMFLCKEVAHLYCLQQHKRKKGASAREVYSIAGIPIADLKELNNADPIEVTTATTNLAHLVHLVSHYLSIKLPAEITLPHRDYPLPTIFSPGSSYPSYEIPYPGRTPTHTSSSPYASHHRDRRPSPHPRTLHIDKQLSILAKDDQATYAPFVEGMTFLAWDIAWLCRTQGLNVGDTSWSEVCAMGKNLWLLLLGPRPWPPIAKELSSKAVSRTSTGDHKSSPPLVGHFSHGTVYGYLATASGTEYMRNWRLQSPLRVIERVKAMLLAERTGSEWELLEEKEWEEDEELKNDGATAGERQNVRVRGIEETGVLVRNFRVGNAGDSEKEEDGRGERGWMKLKNR